MLKNEKLRLQEEYYFSNVDSPGPSMISTETENLGSFSILKESIYRREKRKLL